MPAHARRTSTASRSAICCLRLCCCAPLPRRSRHVVLVVDGPGGVQIRRGVRSPRRTGEGRLKLQPPLASQKLRSGSGTLVALAAPPPAVSAKGPLSSSAGADVLGKSGQIHVVLEGWCGVQVGCGVRTRHRLVCIWSLRPLRRQRRLSLQRLQCRHQRRCRRPRLDVARHARLDERDRRLAALLADGHAPVCQAFCSVTHVGERGAAADRQQRRTGGWELL